MIEVFLRDLSKNKYETFIPDENEFVQIIYLFQKKNVLRGLHFQRNNPQGKLVRVLEGKVFDVAVDLRQTLKLLVRYRNNFGSFSSKSTLDTSRFCSWFPNID